MNKFCWFVTIAAAIGFFVATSGINGEHQAFACITAAYLSTLGSYWFARKEHRRSGSWFYLVPLLLNLVAAYFVGFTYAVAYHWGDMTRGFGPDEYIWTAMIVAVVLQVIVFFLTRKQTEK